MLPTQPPHHRHHSSGQSSSSKPPRLVATTSLPPSSSASVSSSHSTARSAPNPSGVESGSFCEIDIPGPSSVQSTLSLDAPHTPEPRTERANSRLLRVTTPTPDQHEFDGGDNGRGQQAPQQCIVFFDSLHWSRRYNHVYFTIEIPSFHVTDKGYAVFEITVKCGPNQWQVLRRFSEFFALRSTLNSRRFQRPILPGSDKPMQLPVLPPKTWSAHATNPMVLERRRARLVEFLNQLLVIPRVTSHESTRAFLELDHKLQEKEMKSSSTSSIHNGSVHR